MKKKEGESTGSTGPGNAEVGKEGYTSRSSII